MEIIKMCGYAFIPISSRQEGEEKIKEISHDHHDAKIIESPYGLRIRYRDWF